MKISFTDLKRWFIPNMQKIAMNVFNKMMPFKLYLAEVDSTSADYATVTLTSDSVSLTNIVNKTGETLSANDRVWVCAVEKNLGNAFIWVRLENNIT